MQAPVVFVVQNNGFAISTPFSKQTAARSIADRGTGFGIRSHSIDGNDFDTVYDTVSEAVADARNGGGPTLIECRTYRLGAHNTNDDPTRYRDHAAHTEREADDPIVSLTAQLEETGVWDDAIEEADDLRIADEIADAMAWARAQPAPGLDQVFDHVYAEPPLRMERQRVSFLADGAGI
jgi:TPP-dependent pyruvate/acetoin dehydrogenase alpha subunit